MQKETFIIRAEWYDAIKDLDDTQQATILRNLFSLHLGEDIDLSDRYVRIVWKLLEPTLLRNADSYDRRRVTSAANGRLGGRKSSDKPNVEPNKPNETKEETYLPNVEPNKPNETKEETYLPIQSLSDYDNDSVSDYDSVNECEDVHSQPEKTKREPSESLRPPGADVTDTTYYETEICMRHHIDKSTVENIHTAWVGDRIGATFTRKEARQNFASYVAKWMQNQRSRDKPKIINHLTPTHKTYSDVG